MISTLPGDFWRLWFVGTVTTTVRWLETVAVGIVVYEQTGSPFIVNNRGTPQTLHVSYSFSY